MFGSFTVEKMKKRKYKEDDTGRRHDPKRDKNRKHDYSFQRNQKRGEFSADT